MSLIKCPECGKDVSDQAKFCPNCGCPVIPPTQYQPNIQPNTPTNTSANTKKKNSVLSILALIFSLFGCTAIIGCILAVIDLLIRDGKRKTGSIAALVICGIWAVFLIEKLSTSESKSSMTTDTTIIQEEKVEDSFEAPTPSPVQSINITIDPTVIYDSNDVIIQTTGYTPENNGGKIGIYIENNSSHNYNFTAHSYAINGVMARNNIYDMYCSVASGKKANTTIDIGQDILSITGDIKFITILFWAYDDDKSMKDFETDPVTIKTNLFDNTKTDITGDTKYDEDGIRVDLLSSDPNSYTYVLTNSTGSYFDFDVDNISINDFTVSDVDYDLFDEQILNDCQLIFTVNMDRDFAEINNISSIDKLEFSLNIRPKGDYFNDWSTDIILTE